MRRKTIEWLLLLPVKYVLAVLFLLMAVIVWFVRH